jgi:putative transposase
MEASRFTDAQKAFIIKQGEDRSPVAEVCHKAGISQATYFNWKKKYAGLMPSEMKRLRELEEENARLKKIVADLSLDKAMLQDVIKRKLYGLSGGGRWSTRYGRTGRSRSAAPVR